MDPSSMSPTQKDELMRTVQAQVALANMQEMLSVRSRSCGALCQPNSFMFIEAKEINHLLILS